MLYYNNYIIPKKDNNYESYILLDNIIEIRNLYFVKSIKYNIFNNYNIPPDTYIEILEKFNNDIQLQQTISIFLFIKIIEDKQNPQLENKILPFLSYSSSLIDIIKNNDFYKKNLLKINASLFSGMLYYEDNKITEFNKDYSNSYFHDYIDYEFDSDLNINNYIKIKEFNITKIIRNEKMKKIEIYNKKYLKLF